VIGFSFRVPGGGAETLWQALLAGRDLVTSVDSDRWAQDTLLHPNKAEPGTSYTSTVRIQRTWSTRSVAATALGG
jgi:acyl transferase domain-containing protein